MLAFRVPSEQLGERLFSALVTREMCFLPPNEWDPLSFLVLGRPQTLMLTVLGGAGRVRERVDPRPHNGRGRAKSGDAFGPRRSVQALSSDGWVFGANSIALLRVGDHRLVFGRAGPLYRRLALGAAPTD